MRDRHPSPPKRVGPVVGGSSFLLAVVAISFAIAAMAGGRGVQVLVVYGGVLLLLQWALFPVIWSRGKDRRGHRHWLVWWSVVGMVATTTSMIVAWCSDAGC